MPGPLFENVCSSGLLSEHLALAAVPNINHCSLMRASESKAVNWSPTSLIRAGRLVNTLPLKRKTAETKQNSLLAVNLSYVYHRTKSGCYAPLSQKE